MLLDIILAAEDVRSFTENLDWIKFQESRLHQNAVIRSLEIIGEASAKLSAGFTETHQELPWRDIVNMRHRLIHAYNEVRLEVVWATVEADVPKILQILRPLIPDRQ